MQLPGLRVLVPSNVQDAQNMLYTALYDDNPVLFFEHKKLYRSIKEVTSDHCEFTDLEKASIIREGKDATIATFGYGVVWAKEIADEYEKHGVNLEIVDLRSLAPIDWDTIIESIRKTGRILLLQENSEILGPMSELSAGITERGFELLDAPVIRCSSLNTPVPFNKNLESGYLANHRLKDKLEMLLKF
jgi:2-oxoisovalerate dehydrogenase E1 component